jgi:hypothetical protein
MDAMKSGLASAGTPGARRLIRLNEKCLDRSLPRTATQMISAQFDYEYARSLDKVPTITAEQQLGIARLWEFLQTVDWKKLFDTLE